MLIGYPWPCSLIQKLSTSTLGRCILHTNWQPVTCRPRNAVKEMMEGVPKASKTEFEWALFFSMWGFILIALPALYMSVSSARGKKQVIAHQAYMTATLVKIESIRKGRGRTPFVRFHYQYSYQNQTFEDYQDYKYQRYFVNFTKDKWRLVAGRHFPVILSSEDPAKHRMLMFWSDFAKYSLPFPDSLEWTEKVFYDTGRGQKISLTNKK